MSDHVHLDLYIDQIQITFASESALKWNIIKFEIDYSLIHIDNNWF